MEHGLSRHWTSSAAEGSLHELHLNLRPPAKSTQRETERDSVWHNPRHTHTHVCEFCKKAKQTKHIHE